MSSKELGWEACAQWIRVRQNEGQRIVFTNGCFDLLHAGHVYLLEECRRLGDYLAVGVNSDASVRRLKGPRRPITPLKERLLVLGALAMVDVLVVFPSDSSPPEGLDTDLMDTPYTLLRQLRPDLLVKGGDYTPEEVVGREFAGEVRVVPLLKGHSTTALLRRLHQIMPRESSILE